jgi:glucans biosynthesis protein
MRGRAAGVGAPSGNQNALESGLFTRAAIAQCREVNALLRRSRKMLDEIS